MPSEKCEDARHFYCKGCDCPCHLPPSSNLLDFETTRRLMFTWKDQSQQLGQELTDVHNELYLAIAHIQQLEQQLAQARTDYDRAIFDMQAMVDHAQQQAREEAAATSTIKHYEASLGTALQLLKKFAADDTEPVAYQTFSDGYRCLICDVEVDDFEINHFPHASDCTWVKARAFVHDYPYQRKDADDGK